MKYPLLASPIQIGAVTLRNRTVMTAMGVAMANPDGTATDRIIAYYEERARGGVGLLIPEYTRVSDTGPGTRCQLSLTEDRHISSMQRLVTAVHRHGAKIFIQIFHGGRLTNNALIGGQPVLVPSVIPDTKKMREIATEEVPLIVQQFIQSAFRAKSAGADGVEVHAAHGFLLQQFLSPYTNKRTDCYGGDTAHRARIVCEIIQGIKLVCGREFPVSVRITAEEFLDYIGKPQEGIHLNEAVEFCKLFELAGADMLNVSSGCFETAETYIEPACYPEGWRVYLAQAVKQAVKIPVFGNSAVRHPAYAEQLLQEQSVDLISMGRSFLADPEWTNKALSDRENEIRPCISCLKCIETFKSSAITGHPLQCSVNFRLGREREFPLPPKKDGAHRNVAIIGAGPAGLECAKILKEREFNPILFEHKGCIGGKLQYGKIPPHKERLDWLLQYYRQQMAAENIDLNLNVTVSREWLCSLDPYAVIVATGARALVPKTIPGITGGTVFTAEAFLESTHKIEGKRVSVIGAGMTGLECAELLVEWGNAVTVVEMSDTVAAEAYPVNSAVIVRTLRAQHAEILLEHRLVEILDSEIVLEQKDGAQISLATDLVVLALGRTSENSLYHALKAHFPKVFLLGDAEKVGGITEAVAAGFQLAYHL